MRRNKGQKRRGACVQVETGGKPSDTRFRGARRASGDRRRVNLHAGKQVAWSGQTREQAKSITSKHQQTRRLGL